MYRIKIHGRLLSDDTLLIFAYTTLTAANGILFAMISTMYLDDDLTVNKNSQAVEMTRSLIALFAKIRRYQQLEYSHLTLISTPVFTVKFCFLLFFRKLVDQQDKLMFIWKIVSGITLLIYSLRVRSFSSPALILPWKLVRPISFRKIDFFWAKPLIWNVCGVSKMRAGWWIHSQLHNRRPRKHSGYH